MTIIPQQYFGAGDAIFIQSLLKQLAQPGDEILYPILPQFVEGFNRAYPDIAFVNYRQLNINYESKKEVVTADTRILPIRYADQITNRPYHHCMRAKYDMYGLDFNTWRNVKPDRNKKEGELLTSLDIGHDINGVLNQYNLISPYYGSGSQFKVDVSPNNGLPNVYMSSIPGYSLFDWQFVIQHATNIYAVSSSIVYLLELLDLNANEVHLYGRHHEKDTWYKNIEYLLTKNYITH
jgi:hypothetical protein